MQKAILFSGHLPDLPGRTEARFPAGMRLYTEFLFREYLAENKPVHVYLSLAAGADLLFAREAQLQEVPVTAILPCSIEHFRQFSILPFDPDGFYMRLLDQVKAESEHLIEMPFEGNGIPDFEACNEALLALVTSENTLPEAVIFLSPSSLQVKGGTSAFAEKLEKSGLALANLYPDFAAEPHVREQDFSKLIPQEGPFEELDGKAVYYQKKWKARIRLSLTFFAVVIILSAFEGVDEDLFGAWAVWIKNMALAAAILAAVLEISLNPRKGSGRKEWIVNRARAEKLKQRFWMFLFTFDEEAEDRVYRQNKNLCALKAKLAFLPATEQLNLYSKWRIEDQLRYFSRKEEVLGRQLRKSRLIQRSLLLLGALYGMLRLTAGLLSLHLIWLEEINLLACLAGVAVVLGNYQESINTEDLYFQYREMAKRLQEWQKQHTGCETVLQLGEVVEDAENLLAAQNNEWSIRLS